MWRSVRRPCHWPEAPALPNVAGSSHAVQEYRRAASPQLMSDRWIGVGVQNLGKGENKIGALLQRHFNIG